MAMLLNIRNATSDSERVWIDLETHEAIMAGVRRETADMPTSIHDYYSHASYETQDLDQLGSDLCAIRSGLPLKSRKAVDELMALASCAKSRDLPIDVFAD